MTTYSNFQEATEAAETFFFEIFGTRESVGVDSALGQVVEFYSKIDPACDDTFICIIADGYTYSCKNGGELKTTPKE